MALATKFSGLVHAKLVVSSFLCCQTDRQWRFEGECFFNSFGSGPPAVAPISNKVFSPGAACSEKVCEGRRRSTKLLLYDDE